jgi:hypothetical protein
MSEADAAIERADAVLKRTAVRDPLAPDPLQSWRAAMPEPNKSRAAFIAESKKMPDAVRSNLWVDERIARALRAHDEEWTRELGAVIAHKRAAVRELIDALRAEVAALRGIVKGEVVESVRKERSNATA